jgi:ATP-binding cassette subfamily F protein 3
LETLDSGEIRPGHNTNLGYFSQNQLDTLDPNLSIFDTLQQTCPQLTNTELRTLLGCFLFTDEQVFKAISVLSGGEKSKVALAKLMMSGANALLLDEPTNHMDIPAKEVITEALLHYEGSLLCISHDRYFIQDIATDIWEIYNGRLITYCGGYDYYLTKRDELRSRLSPPAPVQEASTNLPPAAMPTSTSSSPLKARKEVEKQFNKVEKQIMSVENEIANLELQLQDPALQQDYQALQHYSAELETKQTLLLDLNTQWSQLAETMSSYEQ